MSPFIDVALKLTELALKDNRESNPKTGNKTIDQSKKEVEETYHYFLNTHKRKVNID